MVTIRAKNPDGTYRQGLDLLKALGVTVDDLVATAFGYLVETGELPGAMPENDCRNIPTDACMLSVRQADELCHSLGTTTFSGVSLSGGADIKQVLSDGRRRDYESLS